MLMRWTLDFVVRVSAQLGDIVYCSWARHFNLTVPFSTQEHKRVVANLSAEVILQWTGIPSREGKQKYLWQLNATEMRDKTWPDRWPWPDRPLGSNTGFMLLMISSNSQNSVKMKRKNVTVVRRFMVPQFYLFSF